MSRARTSFLSSLGTFGMATALTAGAAHADPTDHRTHYVAMGSSFAAGPGLPPEILGKSDRCGRSAFNYAHLLARKLDLDLVDRSCSGATSANILAAWAELPAQIDAVTPDTGLVTVTIGGNDVGYIGSLIAASTCNTSPSAGHCPSAVAVDARRWATLDQSMQAIIAGIRSRAPKARVIFVDYLTVLPGRGSCPTIPLSAAQSAAALATAKQLVQVTALVAKTGGAELFRASSLSRKHDACSAKPWTNGWLTSPPRPGAAPFHPNEAGMAAIADGLEKMIKGRWASPSVGKLAWPP